MIPMRIWSGIVHLLSMEGLRKLTGQTFRNPQEWQKFRNSKRFKKDDWDKTRRTKRPGKPKARRRSLWRQRQREFR